MNRLAETMSPETTHFIGLGSGLTGLALWSEIARHLTVMMGLLVTVMALIGGTFYAMYWVMKAWARWKRIKNGDYAE